MSKAQVYDLVNKDPNGQKYVGDLLKYGDALVNSGVENSNKFRDKYGNEAIQPKVKSVKGSGSGGQRASSGGRGRTNFSLYGGSGGKSPIAYDKTLRSLLKQSRIKGSKQKVAKVKVGKMKIA
jgi:hypothetical protein